MKIEKIAERKDSDGLKTDKIVVGAITKAFGIKGWVKIKSYTDPVEAILDYQPWFVQQGSTDAEVNYQAAKPHQEGLVVQIKGCNDRDAAEKWTNKLITIPTSYLAALPEDNYYWHQLEGLNVITKESKNLGIVDHLLETGANDVLVIRPSSDSIDDRERLIPFLLDRVILSIDLSQKQIIVDWDVDF